MKILASWITISFLISIAVAFHGRRIFVSLISWITISFLINISVGEYRGLFTVEKSGRKFSLIVTFF